MCVHMKYNTCFWHNDNHCCAKPIYNTSLTKNVCPFERQNLIETWIYICTQAGIRKRETQGRGGHLEVITTETCARHLQKLGHLSWGLCRRQNRFLKTWLEMCTDGVPLGHDRRGQTNTHSLTENADIETCYHNTSRRNYSALYYVTSTPTIWCHGARQNDSAASIEFKPKWSHLVLSFLEKSKHQVTTQCLPYLQLSQPRDCATENSQVCASADC